MHHYTSVSLNKTSKGRLLILRSARSVDVDVRDFCSPGRYWDNREAHSSSAVRKTQGYTDLTKSLPFGIIKHKVDTLDAQPSGTNGEILVIVTGALLVSGMPSCVTSHIGPGRRGTKANELRPGFQAPARRD